MNNENPLVDTNYLLQKFPGKGGWTYAEIPEISQNKNNPFGWVKVRGFIDDYQLKQYKLMPMGSGKLFLPVKSAIRKKIRKEAGDFVHVCLYADNSLLEIPQEIKDCLLNESKKVYEKFLLFTEGERKSYLDWIYGAKTEETKAKRIIEMMDRVAENIKFNQKIN